MSVMSTSEDI